MTGAAGPVREMGYRGKLPVVRIDRRVQFDVRDLDELIEKSTDVTPEEIR